MNKIAGFLLILNYCLILLLLLEKKGKIEDKETEKNMSKMSDGNDGNYMQEHRQSPDLHQGSDKITFVEAYKLIPKRAIILVKGKYILL